MNIASKPVVSHNAQFQALLDDADPFVCPMDELQELLEAAPDLYTQGYLSGVLNFRQMLQILGGDVPTRTISPGAIKVSPRVQRRTAWTIEIARGMGRHYHYLHGLSRPVLLHATEEEMHLIGAAPQLLNELEDAHLIIRHALAVMTTEQKAEWGRLNAAAEVDGEGITRANEREAAIAAATEVPPRLVVIDPQLAGAIKQANA